MVIVGRDPWRPSGPTPWYFQIQKGFFSGSLEQVQLLRFPSLKDTDAQTTVFPYSIVLMPLPPHVPAR